MSKNNKQAGSVSKVLLVCLGVAIILGLAGYFFVNREIVKPVQQNKTSAEGKSRDAIRKSALRSYSSALELYKSQNGAYPTSISCSSPQTLNLQIGNPPKEPFRDPNSTVSDNSWPDFCYQSDAKGSKFTIWAKLENSGDEKTSQLNTTPYFTVPTGFDANYYFMQSEE